MLPKQRELELPLLRTLQELGGRARPSEIYPRLRKLFPDVSEADLAATLPSGANKWRNCIAWVRQKLIMQGEMASLARGIWAITDAGKRRLQAPAKYKAAGRARPTTAPVSIQPNIENLLPATSSRVLQEARARRMPSADAPNDFENAAWLLVYDLTAC